MDSSAGFVTVDPKGHFAFDRVKPADYVISLNPESIGGEWTAVAPIVHLAEGKTASADLTLIHGGWVKGTVRDAGTGKPIAGINVGLHGPARPRIAAAILLSVTDANGNYAIRTPAGRQLVYIAQETDDGVELQNEPDVSDGKVTISDFKVHRDQSASISVSGTVVGPDGKPIPGVIVECEGVDRFRPFGLGKRVGTDSHGRFALAGIKPGSQIRVHAKEQRLGTVSPIEVKGPANDVTIRLSASAPFALTVKVTDASGGGIPSATVSLITSHGRFGTSGPNQPLDPDGAVRFESLWADTVYTVGATAEGFGPAGAVVKPPTDATGHATLTLVLKKPTSKIAGTVVDVQGQPAANIKVCVNGPGCGALSTQTDARGHFEFNVVDDVSGVIVYLPGLANHSHTEHAIASAGDEMLKLTLPPP